MMVLEGGREFCFIYIPVLVTNTGSEAAAAAATGAARTASTSRSTSFSALLTTSSRMGSDMIRE